MKTSYWLGLIAALALSTGVQAAPGKALKDESLLVKPQAGSAVAGRMSRGATVEIVAKSGGWLQVKTAGKTGWVRLLSVRAGQGGASGSGLADVAGIATRPASSSRVVSVAGVRGLSDGELKNAHYDAVQMSKLDAEAVSTTVARDFARAGGLVAQRVDLLPKPESASPPASSNSWETQ
jgi:hypothetical protein